MDIVIFIICLCFGLVLTLLGLRSSPLAIIAVVFNMAVIATALVDGVTEQIALSASIQEITFDAYPAIILPALFVLLGVIKVAKYR